MLLFKCNPTATNENIVTERITEGESPANIANPQRQMIIVNKRIVFPNLFLGKGFNKNVMKSKINPTCNPETDSI